VGELVKAVGNVSHGAMVARVRVLENDGVIEEVQDGVGGLWRLK
jgi:DNA-binding HxlR family transcriptional regulator